MPKPRLEFIGVAKANFEWTYNFHLEFPGGADVEVGITLPSGGNDLNTGAPRAYRALAAIFREFATQSEVGAQQFERNV